MNGPIRTDPRTTHGVFAVEPGCIRLSTAVRRLREAGKEVSALALERDAAAVGRECPVHGHLEDPIVGLLSDRVAFGCPDCSGEDVRAAWEAEGRGETP